MDIVEEYYGKPIFVLYGLFAHVPGKKTWPRKIFVTFSVLILLLATSFQVLILVIENFQRKVILEYLPTTVATTGTLVYIPYVLYATEEADNTLTGSVERFFCVIVIIRLQQRTIRVCFGGLWKLTWFTYHDNINYMIFTQSYTKLDNGYCFQYRDLLSIMANDLREERTEEEKEIKRKYAESAKLFINAFMIIFGAAMIGIPLSGFIPYFLDLLIPLNETRGRRLLVRSETLFNEQKVFYQLYLFESCIVFIMAIAIGVTENMAVIFAQHACSSLAVIGHRLENLTHVQDSKVPVESDIMELVTRRLRGCIEAHQKSMQYVALIDDFYDFPLTLVLIGTFSALSVSLAQATDPELTNVTIVFFTIAQVFQLFIVCYLGQIGIDSSRQISINAYNSDWYICTPRVRKLLQMTILRSSKPYMLIVRGMFALCVENFMVVMQTVTSFYMVLRQTT